MTLELVKASEKYREQIADMLDEWSASGEKITPCAIRRADYYDFEMYLSSLEVKSSDGLARDVTFFCLDTDTSLIVGAVNIRLEPGRAHPPRGGRLEVGVRPSARGKGIEARMTSLALEACRKPGMAFPFDARVRGELP